MSNGLSRTTVLKGIVAVAASAAIFAGLQNVEYDPTAPRIKRNYTAGTYAASAQGFGELTLFASFDESSITDIVLDVSNETPAIGGAAAEELISQCLAAQDYEIDGVAGATLTTTGVKEALADCIAQATGEIPVRELPEMKAPEEETAASEESAKEAPAAAPGAYIPGEYTASAQGFGEVKMTVTFDEESITTVDADTSNETPEIGGAAAEELIAQVMEAQGADIDGVAGATLTSDAFRACVTDCMQQAAAQAPEAEEKEEAEAEEKEEAEAEEKEEAEAEEKEEAEAETVTAYMPGEYEAVAQGFGKVKMTVVMAENSIVDVKLDTSNETPEIGGAATEDLIAQVLEAQGADIDGIAGATLTSDAVRACMEVILEEAAAEAEAPEEEKEEAEAEEKEEAEAEEKEEAETVTAYLPGEYEASAQGFGEVKMTAVVDEEGISEIELDTSEETPAIGGAAAEELIAQVLEAQSAEIDGVSGATLTTDAVKACVEDILAQAAAVEEPAEEKEADEKEADEKEADEKEADDAEADDKEADDKEADDKEASQKTEGYIPGEYKATAQGYGEVTMTAEFDEERIISIGLDVSNETSSIGGAASRKLIRQCLKEQSPDIDGVSGATLTTNAVKECLADCISQASGKD